MTQPTTPATFTTPTTRRTKVTIDHWIQRHITIAGRPIPELIGSITDGDNACFIELAELAADQHPHAGLVAISAITPKIVYAVWHRRAAQPLTVIVDETVTTAWIVMATTYQTLPKDRAIELTINRARFRASRDLNGRSDRPEWAYPTGEAWIFDQPVAPDPTADQAIARLDTQTVGRELRGAIADGTITQDSWRYLIDLRVHGKPANEIAAGRTDAAIRTAVWHASHRLHTAIADQLAA